MAMDTSSPWGQDSAETVAASPWGQEAVQTVVEQQVFPLFFLLVLIFVLFSHSLSASGGNWLGRFWSIFWRR